MGDRRCCCGCWSYLDYFTDPPSDPLAECRYELGTHWQILSPLPPPETWTSGFSTTTNSCALTETGTPGATIMDTDRVPKGPLNDEAGAFSRWMKASVSIWDDSINGDVYSILLDLHWHCYNGGDYNYLEFRRTRVDADHIKLELYSYINGVETQLQECTIASQATTGWFTMEACVSKGYFYGDQGLIVHETVNTSTSLPPTSGNSVSASSTSSGSEPCDEGYYAAIRHNNSHEVNFKGWLLTQLDDDVAICPQCGVCMCDRSEYDPDDISTVPAKLLLTFIDVSDDCPGLAGISVKLTSPQCNPTYWQCLLEDDCIPCLRPINVQDLGLGEDYCFVFNLSCGGSLCSPSDPNYWNGFTLSMGWSVGNATVPRNSYMCPMHPFWPRLPLYCETATFNVNDDVVPCPNEYESPSYLTANPNESTCRPLMLVFDYEGDLHADVGPPGKQTTEDPLPLDECGEDCEPCCNPCTFTPSVLDPESGMWLQATRDCHVKFRVLITEFPEGEPDPCAA